MQGDDSSNEDSFSVPADATTPPENHDDDAFATELRDLELRLEQLELEQRSLRIQLQRARLCHAGHTTTPSTPPTTSEPSARPSPTTERSTSSENFDGRCNNPYLRPPMADRASPPPHDHRNTTHHTRHSHDGWRRLILVPHKQGTVWTPPDRSFVLVTQSVSTLRVTPREGPVP